MGPSKFHDFGILTSLLLSSRVRKHWGITGRWEELGLTHILVESRATTS